LSIDAKLQALGEYVFKNKRGAAVAIDPNNGEILAMISAPDYNPALLSGNIDRRVWAGLNTDPNKPLYNRATQAQEPPGSTFKPFMSLIGLQEGAITETSKFYCGGHYGPHKCMGAHGSIPVGMAIEKSCNVFFYTLMSKINFAHWNTWAHKFGFGEKPPVDLNEKNPGIIPDSARMDRTYGSRSRWKTGNTVIFGTGQGIAVSPMQMARYCSTVANGGTPYIPHLVRYMISPDNKKVYPNIDPKPKRLPIDPHYFDIVRDGMRRSAMITNRRFVVWDTTKVGGKTGTAQTGKGRKDHSWFIGFAPLQKPKIAVAVLVENAGFGASAAAPIASLMLQQYLEGNTNGRSPAGIRAKASANMGANHVDWTVGADTLIALLKQRSEMNKTLNTNPVKPVMPPLRPTAQPATPAQPKPKAPAAPPRQEAILPQPAAPKPQPAQAPQPRQ
jgi:penicillin-binding protein 2